MTEQNNKNIVEIREVSTEEHSTHDIKQTHSRSVGTSDETEQISDNQSNSASPSRDYQCVMLVQTPQQEQLCGQHLIFADQPSKQKTDKKQKRPTTLETGQISYTVASYQSTMEYRELDPKSLTLHYGSVTPYGTIASGSYPVDVHNQQSASKERYSGPVLRSPGVDSNSSVSTSIYSSLLRASDSGVHKMKLGSKGIDYVDFVPGVALETCCKTKYLTFDDCVRQANEWLDQNRTAVLIRCESLRHRMDHSNRFNPESTSTDDRSYLVGLRLWFKLTNEVREKKLTLAYKNFVPNYIVDEENKTTSGERPHFEDHSTIVKKINQELNKNPYQGYFLDIETLAINYEIAAKADGSLNADACYCPLELQGKWEIFIVRLFFLEVEHESQLNCPVLGCVDFAPKPITLPPSSLQFQTMSAVLSDANEWLAKNPTKRVVAVNILELPFKVNLLVASKGCINTNSTLRKPSKSSAKRHVLKILRLWVSDRPTKDEKQVGQNDQEFAILTVVPRQLTTSGCCGANKAIFAPTRDTVERINEWIDRSGAEVIDIQTDNVEKWRKSNVGLHSVLPERTYNKEDYRSSCRSALEYRLTVIRVYHRPTSLGHLLNVGPDHPVQPLCCFVGCTVM